MDIRLQKYISERGIASRRKAAEIIKSGRVTVNNKVITEPGARITADAKVAIDGQEITAELPESCTIMLYKPRDYICSRAKNQGTTIYALLDKKFHSLLPVGRLDKNSEGLLLLSNDGELINRLTHPRYHHNKIYKVTVSGKFNETTLKKLCSRMIIDDYKIQPVKVTFLKKLPDGKSILQFELYEGRNRQIRKMCEQVGLKVHRLIRTEFASIKLGNLRPGQWNVLRRSDVGGDVGDFSDFSEGGDFSGLSKSE